MEWEYSRLGPDPEGRVGNSQPLGANQWDKCKDGRDRGACEVLSKTTTYDPSGLITTGEYLCYIQRYCSPVMFVKCLVVFVSMSFDLRIAIWAILDDRLKEKILKPWKGAHSSHSVSLCHSVRVYVCLSVNGLQVTPFDPGT